MTETCSNCRFGYVHPDEPATTYCRMDPPEFLAPNSSTLKPVRADGWCGKWQLDADTTIRVPAPVSDPNTERSSNLSVPRKRKKGVSAIV